MATELNSVAEDPETETAQRPWDSISFPEEPAKRPTVTDENGRERELTDYEMRKLQESKEDTLMRRQAAAAQAGTSTIDNTLRTRPRVVQPLDENLIYGFQLSPSLHEERVFALAPDEHDEVRGYLKDSSEFLSSTRTALTNIDTAYRALMLDKSIPPDERTKRLEDAVSKAFTKAYTAHGAAIEAVMKKIDHTEGLLNKPLEVQSETRRSIELRGVLREMKSGERSKLIQAAISADKPSVAQRELLDSVLGAHHLMVGITEVEQAGHIRTYNEKTQPQIQRRLDLMKKSLAILGSIDPLTIRSQFEGSMRSKFTRATAIRGISDKAAAALAAINGG